MFDYVPLWGIPVVFLYVMRRVKCRRCGVKVEEVPWATGKSPLTRTLSLFLAMWAKRLSWLEVAVCFGTTWNPVRDAVRWVVEHGLAHRDLSDVRAVGVDEMQIGHGQTYVTLVYQIDRGMRRLLKSVRAYMLKESFQMLWAYETVRWATWFLRKCCARAMRSRLAPIKRFARSIRKHEDLILNWFRARKEYSCGVVEGLHRKANLITRRSYGLREYDTLELTLYHTLGHLPLPAHIHRFW
jgi:transposase